MPQQSLASCCLTEKLLKWAPHTHTDSKSLHLRFVLEAAWWFKLHRFYSLCASKGRGHFSCSYQLAQQFHWRCNSSDKWYKCDPLMVLVLRQSRLPSAHSPVTTGSSSLSLLHITERVCVWVRVCVHDWLCVWVSYLGQITNYRDECLFNAALFVQIHKQADINITQTHPLTHTETHIQRPEAPGTSFPIPPSYSTLASPTLNPQSL